MSKIIWEPQPKQAIFMSRPEYEALYGGSAGGGKSDALLVEALRQVHISHYKGLILRKTYPQLIELEERSSYLYPRIYPGCKYNSSKHYWRFKSGALIIFGAMQHTKDREKYQGQAYDFIAFDELTHFTFDEYNYMFSRNRANGPGTRVYIRATANPGGVGHGWVKERFITAGAPMKPIEFSADVFDSTSNEIIKVKRNRIFIPSSVFDNKRLLENNPEYLANLALLPDAQKRALLYGDWDSFSGQVFTEFRNNPEGYDSGINTHVINSFEIPASWNRYISFDFGYTHPYAVGFWAVSPKGTVYRYHEIYGCKKNEPNTGVREEPSVIAEKIRAYMDFECSKFGITLDYIPIADPAIWDDRYGSASSPQKVMAKHGIYFRKGNNARLAGKMQIHERLRFDDNGIPKMYIFKNCLDFIRTVPNLVYDEHNVEDIDTDGEDHIYDDTRYFLMANPLPTKAPAEKKKTVFDPLAY